MLTWTLAKKDLRILIRDPRAAIVLLLMPLLFTAVLGLLLGEGFGQKPDDRLRISVVNLDRSLGAPARVNRSARFPPDTWSREVLEDLSHTAGIRVEIIETEEEARQLIHGRRRAAILVLGPHFSERVARCSFLVDGINPFYRDGVDVGGHDSAAAGPLDTWMLRDDTQKAAAGIMEQVVQVSLLRVILPWMIGRAFEKVGETLGPLVQRVLKQMFPNYNLTAKTWTSLTKSQPHTTGGAPPERYRSESVYQILVPMAAVAFAFFLVLNVGWLFTAERRQGTLRRLQAAPLSRTEILLGKFLPCLGISVAQGLLLLGAGKVIFGMNWGPQPLWLLPVVFSTSLAAMGLALLVASVARTETQVAIFGTLLVLGMALMGGCLIPRALMPEEIQPYTYLTPHAWALDAYTELVSGTRDPNYLTVVESCGVLVAFGAGFVALAWWFLKLEG